MHIGRITGWQAHSVGHCSHSCQGPRVPASVKMRIHNPCAAHGSVPSAGGEQRRHVRVGMSSDDDQGRCRVPCGGGWTVGCLAVLMMVEVHKSLC